MKLSETLLIRVRKAMEHLAEVEEKKMFRGITFMVNGKMCVSVGGNELMCRVNPKDHDELVKIKGCRAMEMNGKVYKGYVYVSEAILKNQKDIDHWVGLAVEFNKNAKAMKKKSK